MSKTRQCIKELSKYDKQVVIKFLTALSEDYDEQIFFSKEKLINKTEQVANVGWYLENKYGEIIEMFENNSRNVATNTQLKYWIDELKEQK